VEDVSLKCDPVVEADLVSGLRAWETPLLTLSIGGIRNRIDVSSFGLVLLVDGREAVHLKLP
jgi:hypothetical protein